ncbi:hypothetical protein BLOT_016028 [Blomia tropicalis]|nr:hypothetical protein BLOT_016028 [Blomia tropicalis]
MAEIIKNFEENLEYFIVSLSHPVSYFHFQTSAVCKSEPIISDCTSLVTKVQLSEEQDNNQIVATESTNLKVDNVEPSRKIPYKQNELQQQLVQNATELERLIKIKNLGLASQE